MKKVRSTSIALLFIFMLGIVGFDVSVTAAGSVRQMEYLDRGTVAVKVSGGVYLSWRLLGTEDYDTEFDVYRDDVRVATVIDTTNFTDNGGTLANKYTVVVSGEEKSNGKTVSVWENQYLAIPLDVPAKDSKYGGTYTANDAACVDVDGDGEYEIILKWDPSNAFDSASNRHSSPVLIDCYKLDGTKLWRIDLGYNINAGAHFTQIAAYDFDLDGKAELAMKTAPGSKDGKGNFVSAASSVAAIVNTSDNYTNFQEAGSSKVKTGDEYYTVFQGDTGEALDTVYYPHPRGTISEWGDGNANRSERYLTAVAYLDGVHPSMIAWRGYYAKTTATAYNLVNKKLVQIADFDSSTYNGVNKSNISGQGNHNTTVGDVDGDGRDEIICGALALEYENGNFAVKWSGNKGHGDALHLADYDPTHEGMEYFSVHEKKPYGMTVFDAATGAVLYHADAGGDTGRGMMARVGFTNGYYDVWNSSGTFATCYGGKNFVESDMSASYNFRIFWNGDTYDELLDGTGSGNSWIKIEGKSGRIDTLKNVATNNSTKNNPCLQADILGDWREEVIARQGDGNEQSLLVYTTVIPTSHKLYTLMHDGAYRMQVAGQNAAYNQPPHIGYYIDEEVSEYDMRRDAANIKTVHDGVEYVRGLGANVKYETSRGAVLYEENIQNSSGRISGLASEVSAISNYNVGDFGSGTAYTAAIPELDGWGYMHYGYANALTDGRQSSAVADIGLNALFAQGVGNGGCNGAVSFIPQNVDELNLPSEGTLVYMFDTIVEVTAGNSAGSPYLGFTAASDGSYIDSVSRVALDSWVGVTRTYETVMKYNLDTGEYSISLDGSVYAHGTAGNITGIYVQSVASYLRIGVANLTLIREYYNNIISVSYFDGTSLSLTVDGSQTDASHLFAAAYNIDGNLAKVRFVPIRRAGNITIDLSSLNGYNGAVKVGLWNGVSPLTNVLVLSECVNVPASVSSDSSRAPEGEKIALSAIVPVASFEPEPQNGAANLTDGNAATYWAVSGTANCVVDLGRVYYLSSVGVRIRDYNDASRSISYKVSASCDGKSYSEVYRGSTASAAANYINFSGNFRYIKLTSLESGWASFAELEAFTSDPPENLDHIDANEILTSSVQDAAAFHSIAEGDGYVRYSFDLLDNGSNDSGLMLGNSSQLNASSGNYFADGSIVLTFANGALQVRDAFAKTDVASYTVGRRTPIVIDADIAANTYDLYVNNYLVAQSVGFRAPAGTIDTLALVENGDGKMYDVINFEVGSFTPEDPDEPGDEPDVIWTSSVQDSGAFHEISPSVEVPTYYCFDLIDNGSNDSGIIIGDSTHLNASSGNYFADGSIVLLFAKGKFYIRDASEKREVATYTVGERLSIIAESDISANTYNIYINGELVAQDVGFRTLPDSIDTIALVENGKGKMFSVINFEIYQ